MRELDAADHPAASSEDHSDPIDELLSDLRTSKPSDVEAVVREWASNQERMPGGGDSQKALVEVLHMFTEGGRDARILAYAMLFVLNRCPYSMEEIGERIGCTRAAISKEKRRIEDRLGSHSRISVTPEARAERAEKCRARGQKKQRGQVWCGLKIWRDGVTAK
jgi:hypothetical protein